MRSLTLTVVLLFAAGCIETDRARERFCEANPEKCADGGGGGGGGGAGGGSGGGGGASDAGEDGGVDAGESCPAFAMTRPCYSGPPATRDAGQCQAGVSTCQPSLVWGPCFGETLPATESCANTTDEDCDGVVGNGCVCVPDGSGSACSTLDGGNSGIGACKLGTHSCNPSGDGYGACSGELGPTEEACFSGADEDCDGVTTCSGEPYTIAKRFGGAGNPLSIVALVPDGAGGLFVVGDITSPATINGVVYSPPSATPVGPDVFIIHFDSTLAFDWVRQWGGAGVQSAKSAALGPDGKLLVAGVFGETSQSGIFNFDAGSLPTKSSLLQDGFLVEVDRQGVPVRFFTIAENPAAGTSNQSAIAVAARADAGYAYVAAEAAGSPEMPGLTTGNAQGTDAYLFRVNLSTGSADRWARVGSGTTAGYEKVTGLSVASSGRVALFGETSAASTDSLAVSQQGTNATSSPVMGNGDVYLATFDAQLTAGTLTMQANANAQIAGPIEFAAGTSELTVAYQNGSATSLPISGSCPQLTPTSTGTTVLARFDDSGNCQWRRLIEGVNVTGLSGRQPVLVGQIFGTAKLNPPTAMATSAGGGDGFIALYGADGGYRGHNVVGGTATDAISTVVMGPSGGYAIGLNYNSTFTYLGTPQTGGQNGDAYHYLIRLAP